MPDTNTPIFIVEDNIPVPPSRGAGEKSPLRRAIEGLRPGQSIAVAKAQKDLAAYAKAASDATGKKYKTRTIDAGHARVWCVADGDAA